jgi:capsular exopolysaccharide synthesis family protein
MPRVPPFVHLTPESGGPGEPSTHLRTYWEMLLKRRWTVLTVMFVVTTVAAVTSFRQVPIYVATSRVEIDAENSQLQALNDVLQTGGDWQIDDAFLQTQVKVLGSDNLAWQTIEGLRLEQNPAFAPTDANSLSLKEKNPIAWQVMLEREFRDCLRVELVRDTRMLEVSFESPNPQLAAQVANALVSNYSEYNFHKKYDATRQASGWMEQQLDELKAKVEKSQQALVDYERENEIANTSDKQNVVEQRLSDLTKDLTEAQSVRLEKESVYQLVQSNESQIAFIAQDELLQRLEEKFADLRSAYVDAQGQFGPNYPKVERLRDQVNEMQVLIEKERKRTVGRIRQDYSSAVGREKLLTAAVAKQKIEVGAMNQLLIQHNMLKREFETNQQLYDSLLQRLKDATVSAGLRATNIHPVDTALPPTAPIRPRKLRDVMAGLTVGLILGVTLAFLREGLDNSIKDADDVERLTSAPVLAIVPAARSLRLSKSRSKKRRKDSLNPAETGEVALSVVQDPGSPVAEAYRALRTSVLLSMAPRPPQVLLVTSSQPGEGKSCTSMNLALALAQRGGNVILVDADLRKGSVSPILGMGDQKGLSSYLTGAHPLEEVVRQVEICPSLSVIPAGPRPPNPAELLSSNAMGKLVTELRQRFDHIIIDSPPVLLVTDSTILSNLVDGVVLVAESGGTTRHALARAHRIIESAGGRILGTTLNKVDLRRNGEYGQYYRRYSYYYE